MFLKSLLKQLSSDLMAYLIGCLHKPVNTVQLKIRTETDDEDVDKNNNNSQEKGNQHIEFNSGAIKSIVEIIKQTNETIIATNQKIAQIKNELLESVETVEIEVAQQMSAIETDQNQTYFDANGKLELDNDFIEKPVVEDAQISYSPIFGTPVKDDETNRIQSDTIVSMEPEIVLPSCCDRFETDVDYLTPVNLVALPVQSQVVVKQKDKSSRSLKSPIRLCSFEQRKENFNFNLNVSKAVEIFEPKIEELEHDRRRTIKPISFFKRFQTKFNNGEIEIPVVNPITGTVNKNVTIVYDQNDIDEIYDDESSANQDNSNVESVNGNASKTYSRAYTIDYYFKKIDDVPIADHDKRNTKRSAVDTALSDPDHVDPMASAKRKKKYQPAVQKSMICFFWSSLMRLFVRASDCTIWQNAIRTLRITVVVHLMCRS
jgi:hypothetical protein